MVEEMKMNRHSEVRVASFPFRTLRYSYICCMSYYEEDEFR